MTGSILQAQTLSGPFQVRDSAGILIATSTSPALEEDRRWGVLPEPVLSIGVVQGEAAFQFSKIWNAVRTDDGRLVVSEGQGYEVRVFSPRGEILTAFGRYGEGPREFGGPPWLTTADPDTLVVWDPGHYRLSRYDLQGDLLSQTSLLTTIAELGNPRFVDGRVWQIRSDGALLWTGPGPRAIRSKPESREFFDRFVLIGPEGGVTTDFGEFKDGESYVVGGGLSIRNPFSVGIEVALGTPPHTIALGGEGRWEVRLFGVDGTLSRIIRADIPRAAVTREVIDREKRRVLDRVERSPIGLYERAFERIPIPDSIPAIGALEVDASGNLWVGRRTGGGLEVYEYDVSDPDGRWITTVSIPPDISKILEFGDDYLLAEWKDTLDVPYLRMYRIQKPSGNRE